MEHFTQTGVTEDERKEQRHLAKLREMENARMVEDVKIAGESEVERLMREGAMQEAHYRSTKQAKQCELGVRYT